MSDKAILFLNGPLPPDKILGSLLPLWKNSLVLCADGGYLYASRLPIKIDAIIGDMDTVNPDLLNPKEKPQIILRPSQERGDFEKALLYLQHSDIKKILLLGITGGRTDHIFGNFSVLFRYLDDFEFEIYGYDAKVYCVHHKHITFATKPGTPVSLIPWPYAMNVLSSGLQYPLDDMNLVPSASEGTSNVAVKDEVSLTLQRGNLIVFENYLPESKTEK